MGKKQIGICKLCQKEKELCYSHILPEFLYLPIYDETHHTFLMIPRGNEKYLLQKGIREYLLCNDCDGKVISKWETYSSPIIKSIQELRINEQGDRYIIPNVQYVEFKLFQLSLLWRTSIASVSMFKHLNIGEHEEVIRKMLSSENPGLPEEYGCMMFVLENTKYLYKTIWSPVEDKIDGHTCYRFLTGRILWYFFMPYEYPKEAKEFFLSTEGILRLVKAPWSEETIIKRIASIVAEK